MIDQVQGRRLLELNVLKASPEVVLIEEDKAADFARDLESRVKAASAA